MTCSAAAHCRLRKKTGSRFCKPTTQPTRGELPMLDQEVGGTFSVPRAALRSENSYRSKPCSKIIALQSLPYNHVYMHPYPGRQNGIGPSGAGAFGTAAYANVPTKPTSSNRARTVRAIFIVFSSYLPGFCWAMSLFKHACCQIHPGFSGHLRCFSSH